MSRLSEQRDSLRARRLAILRYLGDEAWGAEEYVGQENFMTAAEIMDLARAAGVEEGASVLDLCCGTAGPALYLASETGCRMTGVDISLDALRIARNRAGRLSPRHQPAFVAADVSRLPFSIPFDVALLLETMLSIEDKRGLLCEVRRLLPTDRCLGLTLEEGAPLRDGERQRLPGGDAVWLVTESAFLSLVEEAGFRVRRLEDHTTAHARVAARIVAILTRDREQLAARFGDDLVAEMLAAHETWSEWLASARVRKLAIVAERGAVR